MKQIVGVAFIGAGRMGLTHARTIAGLPSARVLVVADAVPEAAERGRAITRAERVVSDFDEAIHHPGVDAVVIVTPTDTHAKLIQKAARAGKAIWCEKPIALTLADTEKTIEVLKETGVPCQIGFMRRFDPGYARAKAMIENGELGSLETFRALGRDTYLPDPRYLPGSGGTFLDMSVHDFDLARFLIGEVEEVSAWGAVRIDEMFAKAGDVDTTVAMLRFENGVLGVVENSRKSNWGYDIRTEIAGFKGKVVIEASARTPLHHYTDFGVHSDVFELFPDRFEQAYRLQLEAFFEALLAGKKPSPGPEDALETLRLSLAARQSWAENRPVKVKELR